MGLPILIGGAQTVFCLLAALGLRAFLVPYDRSYIRRWVVGWTLLAGYFAVVAFAEAFQGRPATDVGRTVWSTLYIALGFVSAFWIVVGIYELARKQAVDEVFVRRTTAALVVLAASLVLGTTVTAPTPRYLLRVVLRAAVMGGAMVWIAVRIRSSSFTDGPLPNRQVAVLLGGFGLLELHDVGVAVAAFVFEVGPPPYWENLEILDFLGMSMLAAGSMLWMVQNEWAAAREAQDYRDESETRYQALLDHAPVGIARSTVGAGLIEANLYLAGLFGYEDPADLVARYEPLNHYCDPEDRPRLMGVLEQDGRVRGYEVQLKKVDGTPFWASVTATRAADTDELHFVLLDITEERQARDAQSQLQEQLQQSQKMEAIGQLTGGIAHDFNNLLMVILGNLDLVEDDSRLPEDLRDLTHSATDAAQAAASLTQRLLAFSRRQPLRPRTVEVRTLLLGMDQLLARSLGETIDLRLDIPDDLWACRVDPARLESAVLNLAINARDAMPGGGTLTVEAANRTLEEDPATDFAAGDYTVIRVTDTGTGISEEALPHIVEPFYTTKDVGEGSGLGLSMVYGFAKQSGGDLRFTSALGEGTTVHLYLPKGDGEDVAQTAGERSRAFPMGNQERVLVVEDDPAVLEITRRYLDRLGYDVASATRAVEALGRLEEERFDVLLTDIILPDGMSGSELSFEAAERWPEMRVLHMSGYSRNAFDKDGTLPPDVVLLEKPFTMETLASRMRDVLEGV